MPKDILKIKALVAMGLMAEGRDGVIIEVLEAHQNFTEDANNYNIDELFYEGAELPTKPGIYMFEGHTEYSFNEWSHHGTFTKLEHNQLS